MHFAAPIPWWAVLLLGAGLAAAGLLSYRRPLAPLSRTQRGALIALRVSSLAAVLFFLCRPIILRPPVASSDVVVPILVDTSRSMRVADADGQPRIARAIDILKRDLLPSLEAHAKVEIFGIGDEPTAVDPDHLSADARRTNIGDAITTLRGR